jgi:carbamoyl-phosphate synthase large subunit
MRSDPATRVPRVLVTGTGGPSGVSVMRALAGVAVDVYATDIDPFAAGLYLVDEDRRGLIPRGDSEHFAAFVRDYCASREIDVLIPTVDSELLPLAIERDSLTAAGTHLVLASEETLRTCLDKWVLHQRCDGWVRVPESTVADDAFDPAGRTLPVIVKPRVGSGSRGIRLIESAEALARLERDGSLLVQEHLPGTEYSLDVLARSDGRVVAVVPRSRLKVDSGIAVTGRTVHDERLDAIARQVAERIGLTSVANVQVKEDVHGVPALLEVNPRFPGTMPLTVASGVDMPGLCVAEALGTPMPDGPLAFADLAMVRHLDEHFFGFEEIARMQDEHLLVGGAAPVAG